VLQWTCYEIAMQKLWSSDLFPTPPTFSEIKASPQLLALNAFVLLLIPVWRDVHFYSAHRFLHIRPLYRLIHSLHHRNTDPEPFSGLCMHPTEHLYYYSNALFPCIYISGLSPLVFHFLFFHLVFAPAAGHSGFEDHFGSDQYHAIHHAKFEANYGSPNSAFIDRFFGTFRETLGKSEEYKGEWKEGGEKKKQEEQEVRSCRYEDDFSQNTRCII
jgi:sterol desaturase/sphingolipid hydroxylase (fatty acid hydroxylase superfamily)